MEGVVVYRHRQYYIMTYRPVDMLNIQNKKSQTAYDRE